MTATLTPEFTPTPQLSEEVIEGIKAGEMPAHPPVLGEDVSHPIAPAEPATEPVAENPYDHLPPPPAEGLLTPEEIEERRLATLPPPPTSIEAAKAVQDKPLPKRKPAAETVEPVASEEPIRRSAAERRRPGTYAKTRGWAEENESVKPVNQGDHFSWETSESNEDEEDGITPNSIPLPKRKPQVQPTTLATHEPQSDPDFEVPDWVSQGSQTAADEPKAQPVEPQAAKPVEVGRRVALFDRGLAKINGDDAGDQEVLKPANPENAPDAVLAKLTQSVDDLEAETQERFAKLGTKQSEVQPKPLALFARPEEDAARKAEVARTAPKPEDLTSVNGLKAYLDAHAEQHVAEQVRQARKKGGPVFKKAGRA